MTARLYKVVPRPQWTAAEREQLFRGSGIDHRDGFIHLSAADQVVETVRLHFAGQEDLLLVAIDPDAINDNLRWEASRGGQLFPHLYGDLPMRAVEAVHELPWIGDQHRFPDNY
jgi:uncharacterized protein (DUF952 family)